MNSRNYNKLYVHTNREEGSEKLLLGYKNDIKEIILVKDVETAFHVPFYTSLIKIADSTLIQDGATAGPFPAASDRIFKNLKNYGNSTSNGTPVVDIADGVWFCSWLYKDEYGNVQWMDRYYNPGSFVISIANIQLTEGYVYKKNDPVYKDVPSKMMLEPGVQYRYFHVGENTAKDLIDTFDGIAGKERIKLNLNGWGTSHIDTSLSARKVNVFTTGTESKLYASVEEVDRVAAPTISFNNTYNTEVSIDYDSSYALTNEFSLSFWAHSNNWNDSPSTQLVGNFCSNGGFGLFLDTLSSYPFFVIPETGYGHLLYVNEGFNPFLDKSLQPTISLTATPQFVAIDCDQNVIVCSTDSSRKLSKFDNTGKLLATIELSDITEIPIQVICGLNDNIHVITDRTLYTYDTNLSLIGSVPSDSTPSTVASFSYNSVDGTVELNLTDNVYDSKFIEHTQWFISATDGNLYKKEPAQSVPVLFAEFTNKIDPVSTRMNSAATTFAIDPYNRIWVLHNSHKVSVYNSASQPLGDPLFEFSTDQNPSHLQKNISFICTYDRSTSSKAWRCLIYYADQVDSQTVPRLYVYDLKGTLIKTIDLLSLLNYTLVTKLNQTQEHLQFLSKGDFTGYERRRVFNKISPFNNNSQLILRTALKDKTKSELTYNTFKASAPINGWNTKGWQHILLTLQNRKFSLYVNGTLTFELPYTGQYELSYELQPTLFIGSPAGSQSGFNREIKYTSSIFNGLLQDIKIYNYVLDNKTLELFQRASIPAQSIYWSLPTPSIQYIETIERMFKNKIPGAKATYFNIKLCGTQITDNQTRMLIEQELRIIVEKIKPVYANLLGIHWVD